MKERSGSTNRIVSGLSKDPAINKKAADVNSSLVSVLTSENTTSEDPGFDTELYWLNQREDFLNSTTFNLIKVSLSDHHRNIL